MQRTFGEVVAMEAIVPVRAEHTECAECGLYIDLRDSLFINDRTLCADCANSAGYTRCSVCAEITDDSICNDDGVFCSACYAEKYIRCISCGEEVCKGDAQCSDSDDYYCSDCYNEKFGRCDHCGCEVSNDSSYNNDSGDFFCESCYSDLYTHCYDCENEVLSDDSVYCDRDGHTYCRDCYPRDCEGWDYGKFRPGALFTEIRSFRHFGVELETSQCNERSEMEGSTCFDCRDDGSISGKEFTSPPLSGDAGLNEIRKFCDCARSLRFEVNRDCGYHAHFDVTELSADEKASVAYAYKLTYDVWLAFVNSTRRNNHFCKTVEWGRINLEGLDSEEAWYHFSRNTDRYTWVNLAAYARHKTFEIRLHTATLDREKVCNWIKAHTRFIDWAVSKTFDELEDCFHGSTKAKFRVLSAIWGDAALSDYYTARAAEFGVVLTPAKQPVSV